GCGAPLVAVTRLTGGGNSTSQYVPPHDGRARAVWHEDRVDAALPAEANDPTCMAAVGEIRADPVRYRTYYGGSPRVVIWHPWIVVTSSNRSTTGLGPRTAARPTSSLSSGGSSGGGVGSLGGGGGSSSGSSGGGGGGGDLGKAALAIVVIAIVALPFINLGLGLGRPEPSEEVAREIDKVNAYNDLARLSGSPCSAMEAP
ncbi:MAG TPA: hypothetical protein PK156_33185, partial [Polyangium sp.]|nr:hypothetical protein [Polyangium sp.]